MKKIQKKWMLFIMASVVSFLGIGYTLIKGTEASFVDELSEDETNNDYQYVNTTNIKGDITGDGVFDNDDLLVVCNHIIGNNVIDLVEKLAIADYDGNNKIDINDIVKIYKDLKENGDVDE